MNKTFATLKNAKRRRSLASSDGYLTLVSRIFQNSNPSYSNATATTPNVPVATKELALNVKIQMESSFAMTEVVHVTFAIVVATKHTINQRFNILN
mmetsp:Transcript_29391/g.43375  ORF Transcript_29391/g.43375 Transcript_29391/m.43375 type:complete len:96 (+) Transcript_29391:382-669(+)